MPFRFFYWRPNYPHNYSVIDDAYLNEKIAEIDDAYFNESQRRQLMKDLVPYMLEQCWAIQMPQPYAYNFWQPWVKGYHGEMWVGYVNNYEFTKYIWLKPKEPDTDLEIATGSDECGVYNPELDTRVKGVWRVFDSDGYCHQISTDWVPDRTYSIRVRDFTHVTGILEVVHDFFRIRYLLNSLGVSGDIALNRLTIPGITLTT